jgi:hypothetical protein
MLRPRVTKDNIRFEVKCPKIYRCNFTDINYRTGRPNKISILKQKDDLGVIDINYCDDEFVIFTDEYLFPFNTTPFAWVAWEFANKLYELDLAFNANSHKNRMPLIINNGASEIDKNGTFNVIANRGISIAEIMRSAYGRNESFIEIPETIVGKTGLLHEPQHIQNDMLDHIEAQKRLYDAYFELLGVQIERERKGSYVIREQQEFGDESTTFRTKCLKNTRLLCAKEAVKMFKINLSLEVVK